ncbi:zinc finger protein, putative [Plasmodium ovale curtisi]|uniref:Zinc finger protein, putative n=1 Tax=Plasmodium ovale curtisi TaxID=864141 RepID=A0A1A8VUP3_PLAOA|nr:zinc finger protein, putative [Plasmodium ovale curtisi]
MACTPLLSEEDLYRFRTKQCLRLAKGLCEFGEDRCQYSHNTEWIRRCPYYISLPSYLRYIPVSCPFFIKAKKENEEQDMIKRNNILRNCVFLTNKDGSVNNRFYKYIEETNINKCPLGVECPLAHSVEEIDYHPLVYKTKKCEYYKHAKCNRYYCPNLHGLAEQRKIKKYFIPFSNKMDIPPYPNVTIVNKIQYGSFKGQSQINNDQKKATTPPFLNSCSVHFTHSRGGQNSMIHSDMIGRGYEKNCRNLSNANMYKDADFKYHSINIPCYENNFLPSSAKNASARYTTYCYDNLMIYENFLINKKKKKNSIFSYLNNCDDKFALYLHILKKFPYLFDMNVSDINSKSMESPAHEQFPVYKEEAGGGVVMESVDSSEEISRMRYSVGTPCNEEKVGQKGAIKTGEETGVQDNSFGQKTESIFLNNTYYDILNHIFMKNLEITKKKIIGEKNDISLTNYMGTDHETNLDFEKSYDSQKLFFAENKVDTYESFLNLLSHVICLLYSTTNSRVHSSFDLYANQLAKHLHYESKKMRDACTENYISKTIKELI